MRPNWDEYYLVLSWLVKERSPDESTKHGCILTKDNRVVSIGYNGLPSGLEMKSEYQTRPLKYSLFIHSEENAIINAPFTQGCTAYITGKPCVRCLGKLIQAGITRIVYLNRKGWTLDEIEKSAWDELTHLVQIEKHELSLWFKDVGDVG